MKIKLLKSIFFIFTVFDKYFDIFFCLLFIHSFYHNSVTKTTDQLWPELTTTTKTTTTSALPCIGCKSDKVISLDKKGNRNTEQLGNYQLM